MSTLNKTDLFVNIVDVDRRGIDHATVLSSGLQARALGHGRFMLPGVRSGRVQLRVEAATLAPVDLAVDVAGSKQHLNVVLGEPGLPTLSRRNVAVPFRSPDDKLGVITRGKEGGAAVQRFARQQNLPVERPHGRDLTIISCPPGQRDKVAAELRRLPEVKSVGRLVNPSGQGTGILTRQIVTRTQPGTSPQQIEAAARRAGCTVLRNVGAKNRWLLSVTAGEDFAVLDAAAQLRGEPFVITAEPDVAFTADPDLVSPSDELYGDQWHLTRVKTPEAWQILRNANPAGVNPGDPADRTFGSADVLLAVMDTGVKSVPNGGVAEPEHPEFQGTVTDGQAKVTAFFDFGAMVPNCNDPMAVYVDGYHGTACAGVAAARANNLSSVAGENEGGSGAAPNVRILAVQGPNPCTETEYHDMYMWIAGLDPANPDPAFPVQLAQGADVITNSWGGYNPAVWPISDLMDGLFTTLTDQGRGGRGTLMFFSAGNGSSGSFWNLRPFAAHARNFGITATTDADVKAGYSNYGDGVDLCAPSSGGVVDITTTTIPGAGTLAGHTGGPLDYITSFGGTSSATPLAAGTAALLLSMDQTLSHDDARMILTRTAERVDYGNADPDGQWRDDDGDGVKEYSEWYGFGMVDGARAVCVAHNTISVDPAVAFVDIPEAEAAIRPVTIRVNGWRPRTFQVTSGPITTAGPAGSFVLHAGDTVSYPGRFECGETHVHLWLRYTGTVDGDVAAGTVSLACAETGETFAVSLSANTVHRPKTALILSLDRSGSMNEPAGDGRLKIDLVKDSAVVVADLGDDQTGFGAVSWDTDADVAGAMAVQPAGPVMGGAGRAALNAFVAGHNTNLLGMTAIGDAVEAAQSLLDGAAGYDLEAMCVLTDGNETASKYLADLAPSDLHSRVYAIGVGTPENINPASLATLTGATNGFLLMTGNIDADDTFLLTKYFQQILAGVTNTEITVDPQGWLTPGNELRLPFPVNETDRQVDAIVHCRLPDVVRLAIEAPDGQVFGPAQATTPGARHVVGRGSVYYRLDIPSSIVGPQDPSRSWYARIGLDDRRWKEYLRSLRGQDVPGRSAGGVGAAINGLRYAFTAQARSSLRMDVTVTQSSRQPGATAWIRAALLEYGYPLQPAAAVWAEIEDPGGHAFTLPLTPAGAGVYQGSLLANLTGAWRVTIHAEGRTSKKSPFKREAIRTIAVWPEGDRPGPRTPPQHPGDRLLKCLCSTGLVTDELAKKLGIDLKRLCGCMKSKAAATDGRG